MALGVWQDRIQENNLTPSQMQMVLRLEELKSAIVQRYPQMDFGCRQPVPNLDNLTRLGPGAEPPF
jgi:hypothetical protein